MRQERFSPSTNVSNWKGRQDYLKGYPGAAMSDALNGGFTGGGGYVLEDSYKFLAKNSSYGGMMNMSNIPQTHKHLLIEFTNNNQSTWWPGSGSIPYLIVNGSNSSSMPSDFAWSSSYRMAKGWSTGNFQNNVTNGSSGVIRGLTNYTNYGIFTTLKIYNYSVTEKLKPFEINSRMGQGNGNSYCSWQFGHGYLMKASNTASPPVTQVSLYDNYQNGSSNYQGVNIYGFGGEV